MLRVFMVIWNGLGFRVYWVGRVQDFWVRCGWDQEALGGGDVGVRSFAFGVCGLWSKP